MKSKFHSSEKNVKKNKIRWFFPCWVLELSYKRQFFVFFLSYEKRWRKISGGIVYQGRTTLCFHRKQKAGILAGYNYGCFHSSFFPVTNTNYSLCCCLREFKWHHCQKVAFQCFLCCTFTHPFQKKIIKGMIFLTSNVIVALHLPPEFLTYLRTRKEKRKEKKIQLFLPGWFNSWHLFLYSFQSILGMWSKPSGTIKWMF